ncbi:hypothetical protein [Methylobacterium sp. Leaf89]|uniref:hypothetical protein n=1 Tax=Methylobacterium sp. Leaf89 TaxID=1736245 RepID=UPI0006FC9C6E|nr:hypothetical protein [Methylobacterium sp. Leaf89]KQO67189.1 hypothetical protein ASF18_10935 [Methylobacterium sp. Leaf89]
MRRLTLRRLPLAVALVLSASAGACAPKPIVARDPVPAPEPTLGYECSSRPTVLNGFYSICEPALQERSVVVRAKG